MKDEQERETTNPKSKGYFEVLEEALAWHRWRVVEIENLLIAMGTPQFIVQESSGVRPDWTKR